MNLQRLTRQERRDLLEEQHQENQDRIKEENDLASFYDMMDQRAEQEDFLRWSNSWGC